MRAARFTFDDGVLFDGFATGTTWNGFDDVKVTPEVREAIAEHFDSGLGDQDAVRDLLAIPVGDDGLVDLSGGYATIIVAPARPES